MPNYYSITTDEQITMEYELAGIGSRAMAFLIDSISILLIEIILFILLVILVHGGFKTGTLDTYLGSIILLMIFAFPLSYFFLWEGMRGGRTLGKNIMHLRVIDHKGHHISFFSALLRNILLLLDFLPIGFLCGFIAVMITKSEQRIGDLLAGTIVIIEGSKKTHQVARERLFADTMQ